MMKRAIVIVLDSVGVGCAPDAAAYGDAGANTLGGIARAVGLRLPNLRRLGLAHVPGAGLLQDAPDNALAAFGCMSPAAAGKDTTTGHWEMAGLTLRRPFPVYPEGFPADVIAAFEQAAGRGTLGNKPASGTAIIRELGEEHVKTGKVIVYTSADSVFQIAAHEQVVPIAELYDMCRKARGILQGEHAVGRVIARPFIGDCAANFVRTARRRDFSLEPTGETLLDALCAKGFDVLAVGKIEDIFALRGITQSDHAAGNEACVDALLRFMNTDFSGLCFANLVDFDSLWGHRRDAAGYAGCLEAFDARLPEILDAMTREDVLYITADHGCDPTFSGTDHTRERVPLLVYAKGMRGGADLGVREGFADLAATISEQFGLDKAFGARSFYRQLGLNP